MLANGNKSSCSTHYFKITYHNPLELCTRTAQLCLKPAELHNTLAPCSSARRRNNSCRGSVRLPGSCIISLCTRVCRSHPGPLPPGSTAASLITWGTTRSLQKEQTLVGSVFRDACTKGFQARTSFSKPGISLVFFITVSGQGQKMQDSKANYMVRSTFWLLPEILLYTRCHFVLKIHGWWPSRNLPTFCLTFWHLPLHKILYILMQETEIFCPIWLKYCEILSHTHLQSIFQTVLMNNRNESWKTSKSRH